MDQGIISIILLGIVTEDITHTFQRGSIFEKARNIFKGKVALLHELLNCPLCLSFWVATGVALTSLNFRSAKIGFLILAVHAFCRYAASINFWLNKI